MNELGGGGGGEVPWGDEEDIVTTMCIEHAIAQCKQPLL